MDGQDDAALSVAQLAQRRAKAIELKLGGFNYGQIAARLGYYDRSHCRRDILVALREVIAEQRDNANELVDLMWERFERIIAANWVLALSGDSDATTLVLNATEAQIRLRGLAAPVRVDFDKVRAAFEQLLASPDNDGTDTQDERDPD
jgi:hypothetical protein